MESSGIQSYAIQLRYEQQMTVMRRVGSDSGDSEKIERVSSAARFDFSLSVKAAAKPQFASQADVVAFLKGLDVDLSQLQHEGRPIYEYTPEEAASLVSEDGYWGVDQTAARLADFVLTGGGDDLERLRAGRAGIVKGLKEAEAIWGGTLPEISYQTMSRALETIDGRIRELEGSVIEAVA